MKHYSERLMVLVTDLVLQQCYVGLSVFLRGDSTEIKLQASRNIQ